MISKRENKSVRSLMSKEEIFDVLKSSFSGLNRKEANERLKKYGTNDLEVNKIRKFLKKIIDKLLDPIILILLVAIILLFIIDQKIDAYVILFVFILNITISFIQEGRASKALHILNKTNKFYTIVVRAGKKFEILSKYLVPGDIVFFKDGSKIPADIRILKDNNLKINESVLTGEWIPVRKNSVDMLSEKGINEQLNMAWKGSIVISGTGMGVVVDTGKNTIVGKIADKLNERETKTPLQMQIDTLAKWIMVILSILIFVIVIISFYSGLPNHEIILTAIAVAVAGIPSGLPAAITVTLMLGVYVVSKNNGLLRNMLAAETLGSTTWILTDKTGTLTEGNMKLSKITYLSSDENVVEGNISPFGRAVVLNSYLSTDGNKYVRLNKNTSENVNTGTSLEKAILSSCENVCDIRPDREKRIGYLPFDNSRRYSAALIKEQSGGTSYFAIGAPEVIIEKCERVYSDSSIILLNDKNREKLNNLLDEETKKGKRVLGICMKQTDVSEEDFNHTVKNDKGMVFISFLSFNDLVRKDVPSSIKYIRRSHINTTMVTGDNENTALEVAKLSGIVNEKDSSEVVLGEDMAKMTDEEVLTKSKYVRVFARVLSEQKSRLLRILSENGEVVAMTGDGVNDVSALHTASIGISVMSATDVAKEASDLILLNNSFTTIKNTIIEGRKIIKNLKKIVIYLLSTSFSEAILIAFALLFTSTLPVTPIQILWANVIEEGLISFSFAFEKNKIDITKESPRDKNVSNIICRGVKKSVVILSIVTGFFLLLVYLFFEFFTPLTQEQIQTLMFITISIDSIFLSFSLKSLDKSIFKTNFLNNRFFIYSIVISVCFMLIAFIVPPITQALSIVKIPIYSLAVIPISAIFHMTIMEIIKLKLFKQKKMVFSA